MRKTLMAEATVSVRRPLIQRLTARVFGRPPSAMVTVPLIAEVLVDVHPEGTPSIAIIVRDGRPIIAFDAGNLVTPRGSSESAIPIVRATLREKGANGRFFPVEWTAAERPAPATGGVVSDETLRGAALVGERCGESIVPVHVGLDVTEAGKALLARLDEATAEQRRLVDMADEVGLEAAAMETRRDNTTVAKRKADYAVRAADLRTRESALRAAAVRAMWPSPVEVAEQVRADLAGRGGARGDRTTGSHAL